MKAKVHLRIAKNPTGRTPFKVHASTKPDYRPLTTGSAFEPKSLPTLAFAIVLDIPDDAFKQAERVLAEITVPAEIVAIAAEVAEP